MNWLVTWFFLLIFVTTVNKVFFSSLNCPYPICITLVCLLFRLYIDPYDFVRSVFVNHTFSSSKLLQRKTYRKERVFPFSNGESTLYCQYCPWKCQYKVLQLGIRPGAHFLFFVKLDCSVYNACMDSCCSVSSSW